tara:strand:- start:1008 stop:1673 length:666 start_codon:yes stop_codon:yes gene_type:complete
MFTGIIQSVGTVVALEHHQGDLSLTIELGELATLAIELGDSVAVNGVCLTAIELSSGHMKADVSGETLSRTLIGNLKTGAKVNLEAALTPETHLGGHMVTGHVDGIGSLRSREPDARSVKMTFTAPAELGRYIAEKGSITIDGVSLTVNGIRDNSQGTDFFINIVPHTLTATTLGALGAGDKVHLEVDLIARYLERLVTAPSNDSESNLSMEKLAEYGFKD